jgi:predicted transcriptional regulator
MNISDLIVEQKNFLKDQLGEGLMQLSKACGNCLAEQDAEQLNELLLSYMQSHGYANLAYVLDENGVQMSANVTKLEISDDFQGQNLSDRPFFTSLMIHTLFIFPMLIFPVRH